MKKLIKRAGKRKLSDKIIDSSQGLIDKAGSTIDFTKETPSKRKISSWLALTIVLTAGFLLRDSYLGGASKSATGVGGGTFTEGSVGEINNLNPLFASTDPEKSASSLIFDSLFTYANDGQLKPQLAKEFTTNSDNTVYTVSLRQDVNWHDGERFDADDVVYTYETIQHPDTRSNLEGNFNNIKVQKTDDFTVTFALANSFSPFVHSLTNGIIPQHIFEGTEPKAVKFKEFNRSPVAGTGSFSFTRLSEQDDSTQVELQAAEKYYRQSPKLENFIIRSFDNTDELIKSFTGNELSAIAGLDGADLDDAQLAGLKNMVQTNFPLSIGVFVFLKTEDSLLTDQSVRQALALAVDQTSITKKLNGSGNNLNSPLLPYHISQLGASDYSYLNFDLTKANQLLNNAGWTLSKDSSFRQKDGEELSVTIHTQNDSRSVLVAEELQKQWKDLGVNLKVQSTDGGRLQKDNIVPHNYQSLLFGFRMSLDPDQFLLWHSSQAGVGGLNISELRSDTVDEALKSGRTRSDLQTRANKYKTFTNEWLKEAPAIPIYQPNFIYITQQNALNITPKIIMQSGQHLDDVENWTINTKLVAN